MKVKTKWEVQLLPSSAAEMQFASQRRLTPAQVRKHQKNEKDTHQEISKIQKIQFMPFYRNKDDLSA